MLQLLSPGISFCCQPLLRHSFRRPEICDSKRVSMLLEQLEELEHYVKPAEVVNRLSIKPMVRLAASHGAAGKKRYPCKSSWRRQHFIHLLEFQPCGCKCRLHLVVPAEAFLTCLEHFIYYTLCAERGLTADIMKFLFGSETDMCPQKTQSNASIFQESCEQFTPQDEIELRQ